MAVVTENQKYPPDPNPTPPAPPGYEYTKATQQSLDVLTGKGKIASTKAIKKALSDLGAINTAEQLTVDDCDSKLLKAVEEIDLPKLTLQKLIKQGVFKALQKYKHKYFKHKDEKSKSEYIHHIDEWLIELLNANNGDVLIMECYNAWMKEKASIIQETLPPDTEKIE